MRTVARLLLGDVEALLPVLGEHRLAERLGAVGVCPLTDHQHRCVLRERCRRVQRRHRGFEGDVALRALHTGDRLGDPADVFRCGAAAASHQRQPVVGDEARQRLSELVGLQWIFGAVGTQHGQPGVGHHRNGCAGVLGQIAQVLAHLGGPGGAVQTDHVDAQRFDRRQRGPDLTAQQHGASGFDRDVGDHRDVAAELGHRPARAEHGGLQLQQVLAGLDKDRIGAALEHAERGLGVRVADNRVLGVAQRGQLGARAHRAQHVPPAIRGAHLVGDPSCDRRAPL